MLQRLGSHRSAFLVMLLADAVLLIPVSIALSRLHSSQAALAQEQSQGISQSSPSVSLPSPTVSSSTAESVGGEDFSAVSDQVMATPSKRIATAHPSPPSAVLVAPPPPPPRSKIHVLPPPAPIVAAPDLSVHIIGEVQSVTAHFVTVLAPVPDAASTTKRVAIGPDTIVVVEAQKDRDTVGKESAAFVKEQRTTSSPLLAPLTYTVQPASIADLKVGTRIYIDLSKKTDENGDPYALRIAIQIGQP